MSVTSSQVRRDLDAQKQHAHHIGDEDARDPGSHEREAHIARSRLLAGDVHHDQP